MTIDELTKMLFDIDHVRVISTVHVDARRSPISGIRHDLVVEYSNCVNGKRVLSYMLGKNYPNVDNIFPKVISDYTGKLALPVFDDEDEDCESFDED